jgi:protein ImuA
MSATPRLHQALASLPNDDAARDARLARLAGSMSKAVWHAADIGPAEHAVVFTGFAALDVQLPGGGWPRGALTEILQPQPSLCEWRLLAPSLKGVASEGGPILLVGPPKRPFVPGLAQLGLPAKSLIWFAAETPSERLWTTEQLIKANPGGAILAWLPQVRAEQLRRLQVHAQSCDCPVFLFRPEIARSDASAAPLRVVASLGPDWSLHLRILKRRGGQHEGVISLASIPGILMKVLTPRLLRPSQFMSPLETFDVNALGSATTQPSHKQLARA